MDLDAFRAVREPRWNRLDQLSRKRRLSGAEADELTRLYQSTAGDLSAARSAVPEPTLISGLSISLARARVWLTGTSSSTGSAVGSFLLWGLAAAFYRVRWWTIGVAIAFVAIATVTAVWTVNSPEALALIGTAEDRARIAQFEFESYYVEYDSTSFGAMVWTNNALIAAQSIAFGFTGFYPLLMIYQNAVNVGVTGAIMAEADLLDIFFQLLLPHGLLELTAIFVAAAAGLRLFWAILVPGPLPRGRAVAEAGRTVIAVAIGLVGVLFISALIEGYITGSDMSWVVKNAVGALALVAFWLYTFVIGRAAHDRGVTGDVQGDFATASVEVRG